MKAIAIRRIKVLAGSMVFVLALLVGSSSVANAGAYAFTNGNFDTDLSGWTVTGGAGLCVWDSLTGFPSAGSAIIYSGSNCGIESTGEAFGSTNSMTVYFNYHNPTGAALQFGMLVADRWMVDWTLPPCVDWCGAATGWVNVPAGDVVHVYFDNMGTALANVDTVTYDVGSPSFSATATPTGPATPAPVSGSGALAMVTVSASSPAYDSGVTPSPLHYSASPGASSDLTSANRLVAENQVWGFCLPNQVTQIFTDVPMCLELGTLIFPTWRFMGIDMVPYLSIIGSVLFIVFLIRQMQER